MCVIANQSPMAANEPGKKPNAEILESELSGFGGQTAVPAYSIVLFNFRIK